MNTLCIYLCCASWFVPSDAETCRKIEQARSVVDRCRDVEYIERTLVELSASGKAQAVDYVTSLLCSEPFLERLQESDKKRQTFWHFTEFHAYRMVRAVAGSGLPAEAALLKLASDSTFMANADRVMSLIDACLLVKNPSQKLLNVLDALGKPKTYTHRRAVRALVTIGTPDALRLVQKRFLSPESSWGLEYDLLKSQLLVRRNEQPIVKLYRTAIEANYRYEVLRNHAVQTLFDYRPKEWYLSIEEPYPVPPPRKEASTEVLREFVEIAELTKRQDLSPETREGVAKAVKEIKAILAEREKGK